ncbi:RnfABCDGE type electron transport complex subunit D [Acholeplasma vituli]|uniref:RnfABCDGE type electron transport complex subunit D n=1 Tax=Paracholeplasma vituli TaxID=69473 RepID=A0ABT2PWW7_9MOLU|nr:RnfABCDGE type electron transport complex subunit D [Paracholeplasma vituli]MCU0104824.1 RnfABCDGE type electron transport complex subunit D [Paracholeplasma vituli]
MESDKTSSHLDVLTRRNLLIYTGVLFVLLVSSSIIFGLYAFLIALIAVLGSVSVEVAFAKIRKKPLDYSLLITPLIFTLMMPPTVPLWIVIIGSVFGTFFAKSLFGGLGKNVFNPALVGYIFVTISFPKYMNTQWLNPQTDVVASTTPLIQLNNNALGYNLWELLVGNVPGSLGETFRIGILVLGLALIVLKIIDWRITLSLLTSIFVINLVGGWIVPELFRDPISSLLVGSVLFAAFFVATDPVTAPTYGWGRVAYGIGIGVIIMVIRADVGAYPEGTAFAIVIMNAIAPLIDSYKKEPSMEVAA